MRLFPQVLGTERDTASDSSSALCVSACHSFRTVRAAFVLVYSYREHWKVLECIVFEISLRITREQASM